MCEKMEVTTKLYFLIGIFGNGDYKNMAFVIMIMVILLLLVGIYKLNVTKTLCKRVAA